MAVIPANVGKRFATRLPCRFQREHRLRALERKRLRDETTNWRRYVRAVDAVLLVVIGILGAVWGASFLFIKIGVAEMAPEVLVESVVE